MRSHSGEKPHRCTMCEYSCIQALNLTEHMMRAHTGEKLFKPVQLCLYLFFSFQQHMRTHSGEKLFKCNHCCDKTLNKSDSWMRSISDYIFDASFEIHNITKSVATVPKSKDIFHLHQTRLCITVVLFTILEHEQQTFSRKTVVCFVFIRHKSFSTHICH